MPSKSTGEALKVTKVEISKGRAFIKIGKKKFSFDPSRIGELKIRKGDSIDEARFKELEAISEFDGHLLYAEKLLSKDGYSCFEMRRKLWKRGANLEDSRAIVHKMKLEGLLDDRDFANYYAYDVAKLKLIGKRRVIYDLKKKGIDEEVLQELTFTHEGELKKAKDFVSKADKKPKKGSWRREKEKVTETLLRKGFDPQVVEEALSGLSRMGQEAEREALKADYETAKAKYGRKYGGKELRIRLYKALLSKGYELDDVVWLLKEE